MRAIIVLLLLTIIRAEISNTKAFEALDAIRKIFKEKELVPHSASEKCFEKTKDLAGLTILGGLIFLLAAPFLAPLAAAPGLYGAAAYSSGLATLGFGSLAAGGAGMAGGMVTLFALGGITGLSIGYTLDDCSVPNKSYDKILDDKGKILFEGIFSKNIPESGKFYFGNKIYECTWEFCKIA